MNRDGTIRRAVRNWSVVALVGLSAGCHASRDGSKSTAPLPSSAAAQPPEVRADAAEATGPQLRAELLVMRDKDQELRAQVVSGENRLTAAYRLNQLDAAHTTRMREIVDEYGWPTQTMVGKDGAGAAWLLIQHADGAIDFQRRCLDLMQPLVERGDVSAVQVAYLTDRVRVHEGRPQLYGTQFRLVGDEWEPFPIEDPGQVDQRRADAGLEPLAEYRAQIQRSYGKAGGE